MQTAASKPEFEFHHVERPDEVAQAILDQAVATGGAYEVLRWQMTIDGLPDKHELYKFNNNYTAYYARELAKDPKLGKLFKFRGMNGQAPEL